MRVSCVLANKQICTVAAVALLGCWGHKGHPPIHTVAIEDAVTQYSCAVARGMKNVGYAADDLTKINIELDEALSGTAELSIGKKDTAAFDGKAAKESTTKLSIEVKHPPSVDTCASFLLNHGQGRRFALYTVNPENKQVIGTMSVGSIEACMDRETSPVHGTCTAPAVSDGTPGNPPDTDSICATRNQSLFYGDTQPNATTLYYHVCSVMGRIHCKCDGRVTPPAPTK